MSSRLLVLFGVALILSAIGAAGQVFAADAPTDYTQFSLDDLMEMNVVSGASKYMQKASEAPSSISIITAEEIRVFGWRNLSEALSSLRGFYDTYDRDYTYMGVRGIGYPGDLSSRLLVLVDGVRMNDTAIGGTLMGKGFPVDLDLISRIEIIRGPASSLYGTNAMVGIVNIVTREGYQLNGTQLKTGYSSFGGQETRITHGHETESGIDMLFSMTKGVSEGQDFYFREFDIPEYPWLNDGVAEGCDREEWDQLYAKVLYEGLTLEGMYVWRSKEYPMGGMNMRFNDDRAKSVDIQTALAATYKRKLPWNVDMAFRSYYQNFTSEIRYPFDFSYDGDAPEYVEEGVMENIYNYGKRLTSELDLTKVLPGGHVVAAGLEHQKTFQSDTYDFDEAPHYVEWYTKEGEPVNYSAYMLGDVHVMKGLILNLGFRHDHYKSFGGSTNPRLAVVTEPISGTVLKAAYGKAFRAPLAYELPEEEVGELVPNEIKTIELIWEQTLPGNLNSTVSLYDWDYKDIAKDVAPEDMGAYYLEHEAIRSKGVEIELAGKLPLGIRGRASWSFNEAEEPESVLDRGEPKGPKHMVKANFMVPLKKDKTYLGLELRSYGERLTVRKEMTEAFTLLNLTLVDTSLLGGPEIRASIYNVFNSPNGHPGTWGEDQQVIWQDGRSFRLYLTLAN